MKKHNLTRKVKVKLENRICAAACMCVAVNVWETEIRQAK